VFPLESVEIMIKFHSGVDPLKANDSIALRVVEFTRVDVSGCVSGFVWIFAYCAGMRR